MTVEQVEAATVISSPTWKKLRRQIRYEQRKWENTKLNKPGRDMAAGIHGAYGGVLRMMDKLEKEVF